jgi:hypothetical protein
VMHSLKHRKDSRVAQELSKNSASMFHSQFIQFIPAHDYGRHTREYILDDAHRSVLEVAKESDDAATCNAHASCSEAAYDTPCKFSLAVFVFNYSRYIRWRLTCKSPCIYTSCSASTTVGSWPASMSILLTC